MRKVITLMLLIVSALLWTETGYGWSWRTHTFIAEQAGMENPRLANIPDASRFDNIYLLIRFHYHNAAPGTVVTSGYIDKYDVKETVAVPKGDNGKPKPVKIMLPHEAGVVYWKIIDCYRKIKNTSYRSEYDYALMSIAHFIGDVSQPLHNYPRDNEIASDGKMYQEEGAWGRRLHKPFDNRFDDILLRRKKLLSSIKPKPVTVRSERDLRYEVAKLANAAIKLADRCYKEQREMTDAEVIEQISGSIGLLRAVLADTKREFPE